MITKVSLQENIGITTADSVENWWKTAFTHRFLTKCFRQKSLVKNLIRSKIREKIFTELSVIKEVKNIREKFVGNLSPISDWLLTKIFWRFYHRNCMTAFSRKCFDRFPTKNLNYFFSKNHYPKFEIHNNISDTDNFNYYNNNIT